MGKIERYDAYFEEFYSLSGIGKPYDVKQKRKNISTKIRSMLNRTNQIFEYEEDKLPATIDKRDMELLMQCGGYVPLIPVEGEGWYAIPGSLGGEPNANQRPTKVILAHAYIQTHFPGKLKSEYEIGKECVVMMNDATYQGLLPILSYYATELVENEITLHMADINCRIQTLLSAGDNNTLESAREFLKKLEDGDLSVITEPKFAEEIAGLKATEYAGSGASKTLIDLIEYHQYLLGQMNTEIGLRAPFNMKREALGDSEVSQMDMTLLPLIDNMLYCRKKAFKELKENFNEDWGEIKLTSSWENIHREVEHAEEVDEAEQLEEEEVDDAAVVTAEETSETAEEETKEEKEEEEDEKKETE